MNKDNFALLIKMLESLYTSLLNERLTSQQKEELAEVLQKYNEKID